MRPALRNAMLARPGWVPPFSSAGLDLVNGRAWIKGLGLVPLASVLTLGGATLSVGSGLSITGSAAPTLAGGLLAAALSAQAAYFETNAGSYVASNRLLEFSGGASIIYTSATTVQISNGTNSGSATLGSGTIAGVVKTAAGMDAASMTLLGNGGSKGAQASAWAGNSGTVVLGNRVAGDRPLNGLFCKLFFSTVKGGLDARTSP